MLLAAGTYLEAPSAAGMRINIRPNDSSLVIVGESEPASCWRCVPMVDAPMTSQFLLLLGTLSLPADRVCKHSFRGFCLVIHVTGMRINKLSIYKRQSFKACLLCCMQLAGIWQKYSYQQLLLCCWSSLASTAG